MKNEEKMALTTGNRSIAQMQERVLEVLSKVVVWLIPLGVFKWAAEFLGKVETLFPFETKTIGIILAVSLTCTGCFFERTFSESRIVQKNSNVKT